MYLMSHRSPSTLVKPTSSRTLILSHQIQISVEPPPKETLLIQLFCPFFPRLQNSCGLFSFPCQLTPTAHLRGISAVSSLPNYITPTGTESTLNKLRSVTYLPQPQSISIDHDTLGTSLSLLCLPWVLLTMAAFLDHPLHLVTRILSTSTSPNFQYLFYSTLVLSILLPAYRFVLRDYRDFLSLGPGGTPSTFAGYLRVSCLRLFTLKDPFTPPCATPATLPPDGYLLRLPFRPGPRPKVVGIAPHRQINQKSSPQVHQVLKNALHSFAALYPTFLRKGNSCFEKHGLALFMAPCWELEVSAVAPHPEPSHIDTKLPSPTHLNPTCADTAEICHLHASVSFVYFLLME